MPDGVILRTGQAWHTNLWDVFHAMDGVLLTHNWLITDWACNQAIPSLCPDPLWFTGLELAELLQKHQDLQWIWAVVSGFDPAIRREQVMEYPLPWADGNEAIWQSSPAIQHPLADLEILAWDSSMTVVISRCAQELASLKRAFPLGEWTSAL